MISIIDYGLGNVRAFANMYKRMNIDAAIVRSAEELRVATKVVLPGVGAFDHAMNLLDASGMRPTLDELVLGKKIPLLGVCVGMQILAEDSEEGQRCGLGWIKGTVRHLSSERGTKGKPMPHMGWNDVVPNQPVGLFSGLGTDAIFYFLHSYHFECLDTHHIAARSSYGANFTCGVTRENVHGVQFHPEKSHHFGAQLLKNFAEL